MQNMDLLEKYRITASFSSGSSTIQYSPYLDMRGVRRIDYFLTGQVKKLAVGAAGGTELQGFNMALYQASNSTGGGASAISSATAVFGKSGTAAVSSSMKMRTAYIGFGANGGSSTRLAMTVNGITITANSLVTSMGYAGRASAQATVAVEGFATFFNNTAYNTSTALTDHFLASTHDGTWVKIYPKDPDGTVCLAITCPSSLISVGGEFTGRLGIEQKHMKDGKRYISCGVYSTEDALPYTLTVVREMEQPQTPIVNFYEKNLSTNTTGWGPA